jgi:dTMP kinase
VPKLFCVMLIAFEGIDGSGKTTQAEMLSAQLNNEGISNVILREPGGTALGEGIREILLHRSDLKISAIAEFLLFSASRAQLMQEKIQPALNSSEVVILDRYFYSSIAYQGFGRGIPIPEINSVNHFATQNVIPDVIFLFKLDMKTALERRAISGRRADRMENGEMEFFQKVIDGFAYCAREEPNRFVTVDGRESAERLSEEIFQNVMNRIKRVKQHAP